ncbi:MAG: tetratricopeptide repeat protein, partial [Deltaproteobacteria bacterium]
VISILVIFLIVVLVYMGPNFIGRVLTGYQYRDFTLGERVMTQLRVVMYYLSLLVLPSPSRLNLDHDFPVSHSLLNPASTLFSLLGLIGLIGLGVYLARRKPLASFGIFWFLGNLVVESSVIPLEMVFEHRLYLPLLGFLLFLAGMAGRKDKGRIFIYGALIIIPIFSIWTFQRNIVWNDEFALWSDCLKKSPNKARSHDGIALAYLNNGMYDDAIREAQKALQINPNYTKAYKVYSNIGFAYLYKGMYDEAIRQCQRALSINPNYTKAYTNLGVAYLNKGMYAEAIRENQRAIEIDPNYGRAHMNLAIAYAKKGMSDEAIKEYQRALELDPDYTEIYKQAWERLLQ